MEMHRPVAGIWDVPAAGYVPALAALAASFFAGGLVGCLVAAQVDGAAADSLAAYLRTVLNGFQTGGGSTPGAFLLLWGVLRWPLFALLFGFTALGLLGLPVLFAVRGFLLAFSVSAFVRIFGSAGVLLSFLLFGVSGLISVPVLFLLGVQSLTAARGLAAHFWGEERRGALYGRAYFLRCGWCAAALCVCILLECFAVPALVSGAVGMLTLT